MSDTAVYVQTNEQENRVVAFRRDADGALDTIGTYPTGGAGDGKPHLTSQGSVVLTGDGRHLIVTNAASDDVTVFAVGADGGLETVGRTPSGPAPKSVAEHGGLVYVLNTRAGTVSGFRLGEGGLKPIAGGERSLSAPDADGAQVGFTPDGSAAHRHRAGRELHRRLPGRRRRRPRRAARRCASSGPTPVRLRHHERRHPRRHRGVRGPEGGGGGLVVHGRRERPSPPVTKSVGNGRSEICWAVVTEDGSHAFTTNFADGAVSRYGIGADGSLTLEDATAGITVDGRVGLRDLGLTGRRALSVRGRRRLGLRLRLGRRRARRHSRPPARRPRAACRRRWPAWPPAEATRCASSPCTGPPSRRTERWSIELTEAHGTEGQGFLLVEGRAEGRLSGRLRAANYPRRRTDGTQTPDFRGVLETDDGATVLFAWHGYGRAVDGGPSRLVGSMTHVSDDARYHWLNNAVCVLTGEVRPTVGERPFVVAVEVAELVWEPAG